MFYRFADMLNVPIDDIGLLSSIPDLCTLVSLPMAAVIADYLRANKILSVPNVSIRVHIHIRTSRYDVLVITKRFTFSFLQSPPIRHFSSVRFGSVRFGSVESAAPIIFTSR